MQFFWIFSCGRNHVFDDKDKHKEEKLSKEKLHLLMQTPDKGGLTFDFRLSPYYFGYEDLP